MDETARTQKHIYVGGSLEDLRNQPGFDRAEFHADSRRVLDTGAFGKPVGADSYFIVVTNKDHHLVQNDGQIFRGSMDMSLVHEFLHPSQITRTLAETGSLDAGDSEARTQMREQKIAEELGKIPGKDFPDVFESGAYGVRLDPAETPPRSTLPDDPALPVDPMKYDARTSPNPTEPISLRLDDMSAPRLVRVNGSSSAAFPAASAALSDNHNPWNNRFGSGTSSFDGITPRYPNVPASPLETEGRLGIVSGKPMRIFQAPIFDARDRSGATGYPNRSAVLENLLWNGGRAAAIDTGAPALPFTDRQNPFGDGNGVASPAGRPVDAFTSPTPQPQQSREPLSLNDAYLEYLKRPNAGSSQASSINASAPAAPLVSSDISNFSGGLLGRLAALMGVDPENPDRPAPPQRDDDQRALFRAPEQLRTLQRLR